MTILQVIEERINDKYPDQKIFDDVYTWAEFTAEEVHSDRVYKVGFLFSVDNKKSMQYEWHVNIENENIDPIDAPSRIILQIVDHYD